MGWSCLAASSDGSIIIGHGECLLSTCSWENKGLSSQKKEGCKMKLGVSIASVCFMSKMSLREPKRCRENEKHIR